MVTGNTTKKFTLSTRLLAYIATRQWLGSISTLRMAKIIKCFDVTQEMKCFTSTFGFYLLLISCHTCRK